jgi:hypothetical protein
MDANVKYYKLIGKLPVPCSLLEWAKWNETDNRTVRQDRVGPLFVSTVFLGLDHNFDPSPDAPPLLFETMIFDDNEDGYQTRCTTWDQAELMHEVAMTEAKARYERALKREAK